MSLPVTLSAVVEELDIISDDTTAYIHRTTGDLITVSNEEMGLAEDDYDPEDYPEWQR